jgi:hypothetical protein
VTEPPEPADGRRRRQPVVELEGPLSQTAWSPNFVVQSIEVLFTYLRADGLHALRPIHADSLWLGLGPGSNPADVVLGAADRYDLRPIVVHSTSWRQADARVVLTYIAVVEPPTTRSPYLVDSPVIRSDLARGDATTAPAVIAVSQVLEHALRHLAWLARDDPAVAVALPDWGEPLREYVPEPFRGL